MADAYAMGRWVNGPDDYQYYVSDGVVLYVYGVFVLSADGSVASWNPTD